MFGLGTHDGRRGRTPPPSRGSSSRMFNAVEWDLVAIAVVACGVAAVAAVTLVVSRKLAESKRAEAARLGETIATLKKREEEARQLALVAETTSDLITITDKDWKLIWVNPAFERVT